MYQGICSVRGSNIHNLNGLPKLCYNTTHTFTLHNFHFEEFTLPFVLHKFEKVPTEV